MNAIQFVIHGPSSAPMAKARRRSTRRGFTLVELLIVIAIIALLSSAAMFSMYGMIEEAKADRTKSEIAKINDIITARWESYRTRAVPLRIPPGTDPALAGKLRLAALRELMRMELPDCISDVTDTPSLLYLNNANIFTGVPAAALYMSPPSVWRNYRRRAGYQSNLPLPITWPQTVTGGSSSWTADYQQAECLYMILATMQEDEDTGLDFFSSGEIGDTDGDGMPEILDAWGHPIMWLRWAPGFISDRQLPSNSSFTQPDALGSGPDPFDPLRLDPRWTDAEPAGPPPPRSNDPFLMFPLIYSAGRDGVYGLEDHGNDTVFHAVATTYGSYVDAGGNTIILPRNDPYYVPALPNLPFGAPYVPPGIRGSHADNQQNHLVEVE